MVNMSFIKRGIPIQTGIFGFCPSLAVESRSRLRSLPPMRGRLDSLRTENGLFTSRMSQARRRSTFGHFSIPARSAASLLRADRNQSGGSMGKRCFFWEGERGWELQEYQGSSKLGALKSFCAWGDRLDAKVR